MNPYPAKVAEFTQLIDELIQIAFDLHAEDGDHFEGGCGDVSIIFHQLLKALKFPHHVTGGKAGTGKNAFTHVWLKIAGVDFDPVLTVMNSIHASKPVKLKEFRLMRQRGEVIRLHVDLDLLEDWDESYEAALLSTVLTSAREARLKSLVAILLDSPLPEAASDDLQPIRPLQQGANCGVSQIFVFRANNTVVRFQGVFLSEAWDAAPQGARFLGVEASYPVIPHNFKKTSRRVLR